MVDGVHILPYMHATPAHKLGIKQWLQCQPTGATSSIIIFTSTTRHSHSRPATARTIAATSRRLPYSEPQQRRPFAELRTAAGCPEALEGLGEAAVVALITLLLVAVLFVPVGAGLTDE